MVALAQRGSVLFRICLVSVLIFRAASLLAQISIKDRVSQQWLQAYVELAVDHRWTILADGNYRSVDTTPHGVLALGRIGIGYQFGSAWRLSIGSGYTGSWNSAVRIGNEIRPHQEITHKQTKARWTFSNRLRVEERYFNSFDPSGHVISTSFNFRYRYRIHVVLKMLQLSDRIKGRQLILELADEVFFRSGGMNGHFRIDQNRIVVGPVIHLNAHSSFSLQYNHQVVALGVPKNIRIDNVIWLSYRLFFRVNVET
ncbi:MAG: DUF2490 domain-containing protein [Flavobacteriales bacterium]|nr:DUF2490 domain-containing protein [Flavobacteriales bacterium]MBK6945066.1 DUF2490 domain-containing protein [Flavobacteriales bacterium]MBK7239414.1 DUF2490 domain-containing protein [Flavobacteriales bacterium]MBK9535378.1 DUF2490 domain-containing protein [Flavobacteriales bacterium]MBP9137586.1 DUF2490 domain-containing protein [Flavobacteriales bacterium]